MEFLLYIMSNTIYTFCTYRTNCEKGEETVVDHGEECLEIKTKDQFFL